MCEYTFNVALNCADLKQYGFNTHIYIDIIKPK